MYLIFILFKCLAQQKTNVILQSNEMEVLKSLLYVYIS